jgi:predicted Holliday junction resolvase-like endonuclease
MDLLTIIFVLLTAVIFYLLGRLVAERNFRSRLQGERDDAVKRSRAVIGGQFSEQFAPFMPGFTYKPTEAKFLGKPTDFIVFEGLDEKEITSVVFVEVKSGGSKLSSTERSLENAIKSGKVRFETYQIPKELTQAA